MELLCLILVLMKLFKERKKGLSCVKGNSLVTLPARVETKTLECFGVEGGSEFVTVICNP